MGLLANIGSPLAIGGCGGARVRTEKAKGREATRKTESFRDNQRGTAPHGGTLGTLVSHPKGWAATPAGVAKGGGERVKTVGTGGGIVKK